ncbi:MAG: UDP-N-acetylmuramoylalanine--D-glutamate ligase [Pelagibacteraceae bacterium]|nr:MAG: UDP-N-acetylmuramoylalanine--D-glutamate ligase [Pelagibacteraceae bacterium]
MIDLRKNFLIYGYGISGKSISKYLKRKKSSYKIYDDFSDLSSLKESINLQKLKKNIKSFDYFIVSPSIKINKNHILYPFKEKILIDLDFLSLEIKNQIVFGVTGTEGKSSICSYLSQYLSDSYKTLIIGNYGNTILDKDNLEKILTKTKIIIIELSSYQLDKIKFLKINHAIITNIYSDHLQYHGSFSNYVKSKFKIQSFLNKDGSLHISNSEKRKYSSLINTQNKNINTISNLKFKNKIFGLDINLLNENFTKKILSFCKLNYDHNKKLKNLPFRNELIENRSNITIINDSKSTNLENSIIKINQINLKKKIIILGGNPKKSNIKKNTIKNSLILIFGPNRFKINKSLELY